ncbi:hypothetical protein AAG570_005745 [Ranatra chinensis]|uniref:Uncharacterized protein n=1 Tax=Ranatra chinensis TaxID=642074 RepID=A0ABD0Y001_9HEMI
MASKRRDMFYKNKKQETTEIDASDVRSERSDNFFQNAPSFAASCESGENRRGCNRRRQTRSEGHEEISLQSRQPATMKSLILVLAFGLCASTQGSEILSEIEDKARQEFLELKQIVMEVGEEMKETVEEIRTGLSERMQQGLLHIDSTVEHALVVVAKAPEKCKEGVADHLSTLKKASFWEFLKCSKLTKILEEGGTMTFDVVSEIAKLMASVDKLVNLPTNCVSWNPWKMIKCFYTAVKTIKNEVVTDIKGVKQSIADIKKLSQQIKANFHDCLYPNNSTSAIQADVALVLAKVDDCVKTGKPVQLHN